METSQVCAFHELGCQFQCSTDTEMQTHLEADFIPHQLATINTLKRTMNENKELRHRQENLEARVVQLNRFAKMSTRQHSITERLVNDWHECVSGIMVDSNQRLAPNLIQGNTTYWRSDGEEGTHWIRIKMQEEVLVYRLFIRMESRFPIYRPTHVKIRGGTDPDHLTVISTETKINAHDDQVLIAKDLAQYYPYIQIDLRTGHGQRDCVVQGLVIIGYME